MPNPLNPQTWEAIFVAGCILAGLIGPIRFELSIRPAHVAPARSIIGPRIPREPIPTLDPLPTIFVHR